MPRTIPDFYQHHQDHICRKIADVLSAGMDNPAFIAAREKMDVNRAKLARLLGRLTEAQRKAVLFVMAQESDILIFQFILECAHLLNEPAREAAAHVRHNGAFDEALASFEALVHG